MCKYKIVKLSYSKQQYKTTYITLPKIMFQSVSLTYFYYILLSLINIAFNAIIIQSIIRTFQAITYPPEPGRKLNIHIYGTKYSRMDQVKIFNSCLPQILLGPFLNTLSHIYIRTTMFMFQLHFFNTTTMERNGQLSGFFGTGRLPVQKTMCLAGLRYSFSQSCRGFKLKNVPIFDFQKVKFHTIIFEKFYPKLYE